MTTGCILTSTAKQNVAIVAAVNDDVVLSKNLLRSPWIKEKHVPVLLERGHPSASLAYNTALEKTDADIVVFVHQDVYLPQGWNVKLSEAIQTLERQGERWGVLGVWGVDQAGSFHGRVWCSGGGREHRGGERVTQPANVASIDEIVIVLKRSAGMRFDDNIPGFHLYATDISLQAYHAGFETYVIDAPVVHNSRNNPQVFDRPFFAAYRYMQRKWCSCLPLKTCVVPITRTGLPLYWAWWRSEMRRRLRRAGGGQRSEHSEEIAKTLGYE